jgi:hypothetical protein
MFMLRGQRDLLCAFNAEGVDTGDVSGLQPSVLLLGLT